MGASRRTFSIYRQDNNNATQQQVLVGANVPGVLHHKHVHMRIRSVIDCTSDARLRQDVGGRQDRGPDFGQGQ